MFLWISVILILFTLITTLMVIISKNPIHSILYLVLSFVNSAGLLILINIEFVAVLFLVIYVGAIAILFLFVIMMLNIKIIEINEKFLSYIPIGGLIGLLFLSEIIYIIMGNLLPTNDFSFTNLGYILENNSIYWNNFYNNIISLTNIEYVSALLFTKYIYLFIISGMVLLVAMIGAIILTLNNTNLNQNPYIQINRKLEDVIKFLN